MPILSATFENIKKYAVIDGNLYWQSTTNQISLPGSNLTEKGEDFNNSGASLFWNNDNNAVSYHTGNEKRQQFDQCSLIQASIIQNCFLALRHEKDLVRINTTTTYQELIEENYAWDLIFEMGIETYLYNKQSVKKTVNGTFIWQTNLNSLGDIRKILGVRKNRLWIWCQPYNFVALNIESGDITDNWNPFEVLFQEGQFYFNFPHFDDSSGEVFFFEREYLVRIDLSAKHTSIDWQDKETGINIISSCFTSDYIGYTAALRGTVFSRFVGVFDRKEKKILWQEEIKLPNGESLKEPQLHGNTLYILDTTNKLTIFEKVR